MAVECIKKYRQKNGNDVLKIILKSTKVFTERAYFYCDASDEELVRQYTWFLRSQKHPYVETHFRSSYSRRIAYQLELQYEDYRYDFLKDRRKDTDILDLERTGQISEDEAIYRHILRYADNAWFYYRYNLTKYFADNRIPLPRYSRDSDGFMIHPITGQQLCPL